MSRICILLVITAVFASGQIPKPGSGSGGGGGGASTFDAIGSGTNTGQTLVVGNNSVFVPTSTGKIGATDVLTGSGPPAAGDCNAAGEVGRVYINSDTTAGAAKLYQCINDGGVIGWAQTAVYLGWNSKQGSGTEGPGMTVGYEDALADNHLIIYRASGTRFINKALAGTANEVTVTGLTISLPATIDLGGKTSFEIPNAAAPTVDAFGEIAGDNNLWAASRGAPVFFDGTAAVALIGTLVSDTPSNGECPKWNTGGTITWESCAGGGSGDVVGPASATDNAIVRFDLTTGKLVQNSGVTIDDSNNISTPGSVSTGSAGSVAGSISLYELGSNGSNFRKWGVPDALGQDLELELPDGNPAASFLMFATPSSGVSAGSWTAIGSGLQVTGGALQSDTSVMLTQHVAQQGTPWVCSSSTGTDTGTCTLTPGAMSAYADNSCFVFAFNAAISGAASININSIGVANFKQADGTDPATNHIPSGIPFKACYDTASTSFILDKPAPGAGTGDVDAVNITTNAPITGGTNCASGTCAFTLDFTATPDFTAKVFAGGSPLVFEGTTADAFETTVVVTDPTVDRTFTIPNADSVAVQPDTGASNNFLTAISALGVISKAQPAFSNLSGSATQAQLPTTAKTFTRSINIFDPVAGDSGRIQLMFPLAVTITRVSCSTKTATSTVTINLEERAAATPDTAGTAVLTSDLVCDTDEQASTTFSNATIASRVPMALTIASVANAPTDVRIQVEFTVDP